MERDDLMTLALQMKRASIPAGESVEVVVALRNTSDLEGPFYGIEPDDHTMQFELETPDGEVQSLTYNHALVRRGADPEVHSHPEEVPLPPGETLRAVYQLCQMSGYLAPGAYRLRGSYQEGFVTSEWVSFEIEAPRPVSAVRSTWDYDRTARSHLASLVEISEQGPQKPVYWLEEGEKIHSFFYHHHDLTTVPTEAEPFLSHTLTYLQPNRHMLWLVEGAVQAVLVRDGQAHGPPQTLHPPRSDAQLLDTAYTTANDTLILFAAHATGLWMGRCADATRPKWTRLLEWPPTSDRARRAEELDVHVQYDFTGALHTVVHSDAGVVEYAKWDAALQRTRQHRDVGVWRSLQDAFFRHVWADEDVFPPDVQTELILLFRRTDRPRWERWTYVLENGAFDRQTTPLAPAYPSDITCVDAQLDKASRLHAVWAWNGRHYYSRDQAPYLVRLDDGEAKLFPQVLLDGNPVEEGPTATCRYRDDQGAFHFRELSSPRPPEFSATVDRETVRGSDELVLSITLENTGRAGLLLPALQTPAAELTLYVEPDEPTEQGHVFAPAERLGATDGRHGREELPRGTRSCQVEAPLGVQDAWFELGAGAEVTFVARLSLDLKPGPYQVYAHWTWADRQTVGVPFTVVE